MNARGNVAIGGIPTASDAVWRIPTRPRSSEMVAWQEKRAQDRRRSRALQAAAKDARDKPQPRPARTPAAPKPQPRARTPHTGPTPETLELIAAFQDGATVEQLAGERGQSVNTVRRRLNAAGIKTARKVDPAMRTRVVAEYAAGAGVLELAREYQLGKRTVSGWVHDAGIMRGIPQHIADRAAYAHDKHAPLRAMYAAGQSIREIHLATGVPRSTVQRVIQRAGMARPQGRPDNAGE